MPKNRKRPKLSKAAAVLVYAGARKDSRVAYHYFDVAYHYFDYDDLPPAAVPTLLIPLRDYVDMGRPDEITVTVEPGNTLGDK